MSKLVLIRHGESVWNKENKFTGWTDVDLSENGYAEARKAGAMLKQKNYSFDVAYTSYLKRAIRTLWLILDEMDMMWIDVFKTWKLNERHYGALQGLNKKETAEKEGEEKVHNWRRGFEIRPPAMTNEDDRWCGFEQKYRNIDYLPLSESLKDTINRCVPFYKKEIMPKLKKNKDVIVAAHGNSLRGLVKHIENISDGDIASLNIPTGVPYVYEFDENMQLKNNFYIET